MQQSLLVPDNGFSSLQLGPNIQRGIEAMGFTEPRPIQALTIPAVLAGRDVLGLAQTGTGKTAAFVLPILERFAGARRSGPRALIVAPTRELATQILAETRTLAQFTPLRSAAIFGGAHAGPQIRELRARPDILVACPGRLLDLWQRGEVRLEGIEVLVLDEADHMLDMGFLPDVRRILGALPPRRQNLLFSATMPREIRALTDEVLVDPHVVELDHSAPPATIAHALYPVTEAGKLELLRHLLAGDDFTSAIVFLRTKRRAHRLGERLARLGIDAVSLQGDMPQDQRDRAMRGFREGRFDVLVATDIAARGIDVAGVSHVINFDVPNTPDAYTHRIGRTGRAERSGIACTFVTDADYKAVRAIEQKLGTTIARRRVRGLAVAHTPHTRSSADDKRRPDRQQSHQRRSGGSRPSGAGAGRSRRRRRAAGAPVA